MYLSDERLRKITGMVPERHTIDETVNVAKEVMDVLKRHNFMPYEAEDVFATVKSTFAYIPLQL